MFSLLLFCACAKAQRLPFFNLSIESGLIQSQATCLAQDKLGRLWVGTLGGLSCYDGATFTNYSARDGLSSGVVMDVEAHRDGTLWVGTTRGLVRMEGKTFSPVRLPKAGTSVAQVSRIAIDGTGRVWAVSDGALHRIAADSGYRVPVGTGPVTALHAARDGALLVAVKDDGIFRITKGGTPQRLSFARDQDGKRAPSVQRLYNDRRGRLLALTTDGLFLVRDSTLSPVMAGGKKIFGGALLCATEAPDGSLWIGTRSGVIQLTDATVRAIRRRDGLSDNLMYDAMTDREGHVWLASDGQGLFRFSGAPFEMLDESAGLPSAQIMAIATDGKGTLFLGSYDAGLFSFAKGKVSPIPFPNGETPSITTLAYLPDGTLWIGTRAAGLWRMQGARVERVLAEGAPSAQGSVALLYIHPLTGVLYLATGYNLSSWRQGAFRPVAEKTGAVQDVLAMGKDSLLLATSVGLVMLDSNKSHPFITGSLPDSATPQCLARRGPELWIGTSDNGVLCYHTATKKTVTIDRKKGLRSDFVYNLVVDRTGAVWAGTGNGIHRIRIDKMGKPEVKYFGKAYGVTGMESNQKASLMMPDGSLWFGTTAGAVHYKPGASGGGAMAQMVHRKPVSLVLQSVLVSGTDKPDASLYSSREPVFGVPQGLRIPYRKNSMTVRFHAVSLGGPEEVLYRYRVEEAAPWSAWSSENTVTFSALPPGKHTLEVEAGVDGKTALRRMRYPFTVITPFHRTPLFIMLMIAACVALGVALQYWAARRRRAHEQELEELRREEQAKVRQRTAEDFHDEVGNTITRMTVLTSVLQSKVQNPEAVHLIEQIRDNAGRLYSGTRDILWSLKPGSDNLYEILHRIRDFGQDLFGDTDIHFYFPGSDERWRDYKLPLDWSRNLTMIFKEALNNCLKYADASYVELGAKLGADGVLYIRLRDNGRGFDPAGAKNGHGLQNMKTRAARLSGSLSVESKPGHGTALTLSFKIPQNTAVSKRG